MEIHFKAYPQIRFVVEKKADGTYPIVSAASIVAKVTRDKILEEWKFKENLNIDHNFGCGYPADELTKSWLVKNQDPLFGFPSIVRFSWQTC